MRKHISRKRHDYVEKTGTNNTEVTQAADALIAAGVDAAFTPTDNTVMTQQKLAIYVRSLSRQAFRITVVQILALNGAFW